MLIRSIDTEGTGLDIFHGCKPFFTTICDNLNGEQHEPVYWEWDVDPVTREPLIPDDDRSEIIEYIEEADEIAGQNLKYDICALAQIGIKWKPHWWAKTHDTLYSAHLLNSAAAHDLTTQALSYLGLDIQPVETKLGLACIEARRIAARKYPKWHIAKEGDSTLPSAKSKKQDVEKDKLWKWDMFLPRAIAKQEKYPINHTWWNVLPDYSNTDSAVTLPLWMVHKQLLQERGLWKVYLERIKLLRVICSMETKGVTYSKTRLVTMKTDFVTTSKEDEEVCVGLSSGKLESLPKGSGITNDIRKLIFDHWKLPPIEYTDGGAPSLSDAVLEAWELTLSNKSPQYTFIKRWRSKRKKGTSIGYMDSYEKFGIEVKDNPDVVVLHSSVNATGSNTLRMTSQNPNEQNISKKKDEQGHSVRYCFGPAHGREWWAIDYRNLELMIPAYEAGETDMVNLFERPDEGPYFGSYHLLIFDVLHPEKFAQYGAKCKDVFKDTWYQWTKNGNFAVQYGAMVESGTADRAYHMQGAQLRIMQRFNKINKLNQSMIDHARRYGFVYTMPDKEWGTGYPLVCTKNQWGKIRPTVPLSYHVQGTAMQAMCRAMVRCDDYLREEYRKHPAPGFVTLQVHDEMVFDLPAKPLDVNGIPGNLRVVRKLKSLMEQSGDDIGVPLKVDVNYHPNNWAKTESLGVAI